MSSLPMLQELIHEQYGIAPTQLDPHVPLAEQGIDSLAQIQFVYEVESRFQVSIDDRQSIETLAALAQLVDRSRSPHAA